MSDLKVGTEERLSRFMSKGICDQHYKPINYQDKLSYCQIIKELEKELKIVNQNIATFYNDAKNMSKTTVNLSIEKFLHYKLLRLQRHYLDAMVTDNYISADELDQYLKGKIAIALTTHH